MRKYFLLLVSCLALMHGRSQNDSYLPASPPEFGEYPRWVTGKVVYFGANECAFILENPGCDLIVLYHQPPPTCNSFVEMELLLHNVLVMNEKKYILATMLTFRSLGSEEILPAKGSQKETLVHPKIHNNER